MRVFLSWSLERSRIVAEKLRTWLPDVLQNVEPWMSRHDIGAGARWANELDAELQNARFGIICLTPENTKEPWLNYEAGAVSKLINESAVVPYLIGMHAPTDVPQGPLSRFQAKLATREETLSVVLAINAAMGDVRLSDDRVQRAFERCWPEFQDVLERLPIPKEAAKGPTLEGMTREILDHVRDSARIQVSEATRYNTERFAEIASYVMDAPELRAAGISGITAETRHDGYLFGGLDKQDKPFSVFVSASGTAATVARRAVNMLLATVGMASLPNRATASNRDT